MAHRRDPSAHDQAPHDDGSHGHDSHRFHSHGAHGGPHAGHAHGGGDNRFRTALAAALTAGFMLVEAGAGLYAGSLALLADAGHMLTDAVALGLAALAFSLSRKQGDERLSYGWDRLKTLVAFVNGLAVFAIGIWIAAEAVVRFAQPVPILGGPMLAVGLAGLGVNLAAFFILSGGERDLNMRGALLHVAGDLLGSLAAIVAAAVILRTGWTPIDPILSALVALLLFRSAFALTAESGRLLLEGAPTGIDRDAVRRDLLAHVPGVADIHHMHVWSLDGTRHMATLHAVLRPDASAGPAIRALKARLDARHGIGHATVEPEWDGCADAAARRSAA